MPNDQKINLLKAALEKQPSVSLAYLFGSQVKGLADEQSDWDLAVFFSEPLERHGLWPAFDLEAKLATVIQSPVQVTILNQPLTPVFGFEIVKDGWILIDRDIELRLDFEMKTLRNYYDWLYVLNRQMASEQ